MNYRIHHTLTPCEKYGTPHACQQCRETHAAIEQHMNRLAVALEDDGHAVEIQNLGGGCMGVFEYLDGGYMLGTTATSEAIGYYPDDENQPAPAQLWEADTLANLELGTGDPSQWVAAWNNIRQHIGEGDTYHGIREIRCNLCGYTTRRTDVMETWNDITGTCPQCTVTWQAEYVDTRYLIVDNGHTTYRRINGDPRDPDQYDYPADTL